MRLDMSQLHGLDSRSAELMGKPHLGAHYEREDYRSHKLDENARCVICGRVATDAHHVVPRGHTRGFTVDTPMGKFVCLTPLFALCRTCHEGFHGQARYVAAWEWIDEKHAEQWWEGHTLVTLRPHDKLLFEQGYYTITDKKEGREIRLTR